MSDRETDGRPKQGVTVNVFRWTSYTITVFHLIKNIIYNTVSQTSIEQAKPCTPMRIASSNGSQYALLWNSKFDPVTLKFDDAIRMDVRFWTIFVLIVGCRRRNKFLKTIFHRSFAHCIILTLTLSSFINRKIIAVK